GLRGQVTGPAVRTAYHRDVLNDEEGCTLPITPCDPADACPFVSTHSTHHCLDSSHYSRRYTVMMISLPVNASLATTMIGSSARVLPAIRYFHSPVSWSFCRSTISPLRIAGSTSSIERSSSSISS